MMKGCLLSLLGVAVAAFALAQDHPEHPKKGAQKEAMNDVVEVVVTGENYCLGCALKSKYNAAAQCSKYGHRHALKVSSATVGGKDAPELKGWVLHYLETDDAQPYITGHHEETLTLKGKVYSEARVLEMGGEGVAKKPEHPEHPNNPEHPEHPK